MRFTQFGPTGLRVSELCLGAMTFGSEWGWGADAATSRHMFDLFAEAGGNFIDTANVYTEGTSERLVGEFVGGERQRFVVATKYSLNMRPNDPNAGGNHRKSLIHSVESSLKNMRLDYVDIIWVHAWDFLTPEEEVLRGLDDLVSAGKVLYTGISDTPAWVISRSNAIGHLRGWTSFAGIQLPYSLIERTPEREFLPMAASLGLAITAWNSLGGGLLTGKYRGKASGDLSGRMLLQQNASGSLDKDSREHAIVEALCEIANEIACTPAQAALAWVRQRSVPIIPLLGARTVEQLKDNLSCLDVVLSETHVASLDAVSYIQAGFPHEFLRTQAMIEMLHGKTYPLLTPRRFYGK